jgi:hypothetical protein
MVQNGRIKVLVFSILLCPQQRAYKRQFTAVPLPLAQPPTTSIVLGEAN